MTNFIPKKIENSEVSFSVESRYSRGFSRFSISRLAIFIRNTVIKRIVNCIYVTKVWLASTGFIYHKKNKESVSNVSKLNRDS